MNTQVAFERVRALTADYDKDYATDDRLMPLAQQALEDLYAELTNMDLGFDEQVIELTNIAANTSDLSAYNVSGQPLENMMQPLHLEWKLAGDPPQNYREVRYKDQVASVPQQQIVSGYEYTGGIIKLTLCNAAIDLRLRGEFLPPVLTMNSDVRSPLGITFVLAYMICVFIGIGRGKPVFVKEYGAKAARGLDNIESKLNKGQQGKVHRFGRTVGRSRAGWGFPTIRR